MLQQVPLEPASPSLSGQLTLVDFSESGIIEVLMAGRGPTLLNGFCPAHSNKQIPAARIKVPLHWLAQLCCAHCFEQIRYTTGPERRKEEGTAASILFAFLSLQFQE